MRSAHRQFANETALGGMEDVALGKIAVQKAQNDKVKQFGQRMIVTLPGELDAEHKTMVEKFSSMSEQSSTAHTRLIW
jgi:predicted outer membrane protein